jgi:uncharacterized protein (TIGR02466 family)
MINVNIHHLFPTLLTETECPVNEKFLNIIYDNWEKHYTEGYSNEGTGNLNIQTDESFRDIYSFLNECVLEYLNILKIDNENFDINFVKSWFNSLEKASTPRHFHGDAHISVVYYAQTPLDAEQFIQFESNNESKEPFPGAAKNNAMGINEFNAYYYSIKPKAGSVLVFPSNLFHQTFGENKSLDNIEPAVRTIEDLKRKRICIASDVVLTYKEKSNKSLGLQPVSLWRRF